MATEIKRRFLVDVAKWASVDKPTGRVIRLGYLLTSSQKSLRVRIIGRQAWLGVRLMTTALTHEEHEYEIPLEDAEEMMATMVDGAVEKVRYDLPSGPHPWAVDEYHGANTCLVMASVKISHAGETIALPEWVGREVTDDIRYLNHSLALRPWCAWGGSDIRIINLTPYPVVMLDEQGLVFREFPPAAHPVMISSSHEDTGYRLQQIRVTTTVYGPADGLPDAQPGLCYIVTHQVKAACPHRHDLLVPGEAVKESGGTLWGFRSLNM